MTEIPLNRQGHPSPLIFHLGAAVFGYQSALAFAANPQSPFTVWQSELQTDVLEIGPLDILRLTEASVGRMRSMLTGLSKWQTHPYQRAVTEPEVVWSGGSSRLLDYGTCPESTNPSGPPILVIPSMINRAYILDLHQNCSLVRFLASQGLRPLLLDWGVPTDTERGFNLDSYVENRVLPALDVARSLSKNPIGVLGYCMGGTLAAGVLAQGLEGIAAFATIGSPWDFDASAGVTAALQTSVTTSKAAQFLEDQGQVFGMIPTIFFQQMFAAINPIQAAVKFRKFNELDQNGTAAKHFVAIEDWLADGVPLVTPTAKDLLVGWNVDNATAKGSWRLSGNRVDVRTIRQPTLCICGKRDSITQLSVASALPDSIPNAKKITPDAGHVGMIVGSKARESVWEPIANFFTDQLRNGESHAQNSGKF